MIGKKQSQTIAGKTQKPNTTAKSEGEKYPRKAVHLYGPADESEESQMQKYAELMTSPDFAAHRVIRAAEAKSGAEDYIDVPALMQQLRDESKAVNSGDLKQAEAMLMNQATALQSLFSRLAARGMGCDNVTSFESNMRMALRAQSQSRATLETLAAIKNPPIVYARQANIANGPQQVNNGVPAHARENENLQNKLSEGENELLQNAGTPTLAGGVNQTVEALEAIDRAEVKGG